MNNKNYILESHLPTSDSNDQRQLRRSIKFRKKKPRVAFISPQVISAKNQMRKCAPPLGLAALAAVFTFSIAMVVWGRNGDGSIDF